MTPKTKGGLSKNIEMIGARQIVIGTRDSPLALAQTRTVLNLLRKRNSRRKLDFQIKKIKTEGDADLKRNSGTLRSIPPNFTGKDSFTRAIDRALIDGKIDIAVHSLKDVPANILNSKVEDVIEIGAFPKRGSPYDVLITKRKSDTLATLPKNARIGTSSVRRGSQLKSFRPDFVLVGIRGNIQTRIKKLRNSEDLDAIVLAKAGLKRLKLPIAIGKILPKSIMLPAIGQGCLAVSICKKDSYIKSVVSKIDDKRTRLAVTAERAFSNELGGGCNLPIAALATIRNERLLLEGLVEFEDPKMIARSQISGPPKEAEALGRKLANQLKGIGS